MLRTTATDLSESLTFKASGNFVQPTVGTRAWGSVVVKALPTSRTVPGSIPGGFTGDFFPWLPPTELCALGSTQPLKMSTRDFS